jgi:hypothetical protein
MHREIVIQFLRHFMKYVHVILNKSKLAYRIYVILIANKEFKKKLRD